MAVVIGGMIMQGASMLYGMSSSKKAAKAAKRAAKEEASRIRWNADEVERSVEINDQAFAYNIEASEIASKFNVEQLNREAAFAEWATAYNDTIGRRQKRRQQGSQVVAIARSGVTSSSSGYDVMRDSEIETELELQANAYAGLRQAHKLRQQAEITRIQGENEAWNLNFQRTEEKRMGALEAKDLRWQAKVAEMGGSSRASALRRQGTAQLLDGLAGMANTYMKYGGGTSTSGTIS
jgi:hypothetical protein